MKNILRKEPNVIKEFFIKKINFINQKCNIKYYCSSDRFSNINFKDENKIITKKPKIYYVKKGIEKNKEVLDLLELIRNVHVSKKMRNLENLKKLKIYQFYIEEYPECESINNLPEFYKIIELKIRNHIDILINENANYISSRNYSEFISCLSYSSLELEEIINTINICLKNIITRKLDAYQISDLFFILQNLTNTKNMHMIEQFPEFTEYYFKFINNHNFHKIEDINFALYNLYSYTNSINFATYSFGNNPLSKLIKSTYSKLNSASMDFKDFKINDKSVNIETSVFNLIFSKELNIKNYKLIRFLVKDLLNNIKKIKGLDVNKENFSYIMKDKLFKLNFLIIFKSIINITNCLSKDGFKSINPIIYKYNKYTINNFPIKGKLPIKSKEKLDIIANNENIYQMHGFLYKNEYLILINKYYCNYLTKCFNSSISSIYYQRNEVLTNDILIELLNKESLKIQSESTRKCLLDSLLYKLHLCMSEKNNFSLEEKIMNSEIFNLIVIVFQHISIFPALKLRTYTDNIEDKDDTNLWLSGYVYLKFIIENQILYQDEIITKELYQIIKTPEMLHFSFFAKLIKQYLLMDTYLKSNNKIIKALIYMTYVEVYFNKNTYNEFLLESDFYYNYKEHINRDINNNIFIDADNMKKECDDLWLQAMPQVKEIIYKYDILIAKDVAKLHIYYLLRYPSISNVNKYILTNIRKLINLKNKELNYIENEDSYLTILKNFNQKYLEYFNNRKLKTEEFLFNQESINIFKSATIIESFLSGIGICSNIIDSAKDENGIFKCSKEMTALRMLMFYEVILNNKNFFVENYIFFCEMIHEQLVNCGKQYNKELGCEINPITSDNVLSLIKRFSDCNDENEAIQIKSLIGFMYETYFIQLLINIDMNEKNTLRIENNLKKVPLAFNNNKPYVLNVPNRLKDLSINFNNYNMLLKSGLITLEKYKNKDELESNTLV